jgi:putative MATE family efflux protein
MQNRDHNHNILDTSQIGRLLVKLSVPMFFGMSVQVIYSIIDTIFIGHYVGSSGIAVLSVIFPIQMITMGVGNMVGVGGASLISRLIGGSDRKRAELALGNSIFFSILFGVALTLLILPGINSWLRLIHASSNLFPVARIFLIVTVSGTVINLLNSVLLGMVRAEGNARVNMISMILASVLNIFLDYLFMNPLHMGIKGAALATVISQGISLVYVLSYYLSGSAYLKIRWRNFKPDFSIMKSIFSIGVSQLFQTSAFSIAAFFIVRMATTYGGDTALSAFGIVQRILGPVSQLSQVLGQAMQPIIGFNYGAGRYKQVLKTFKIAAFWVVAISLVIVAVIFIVPGRIVAIFTNDTQLISATVIAVRHIFLMIPLFGFFNIGQQVFTSIGKAVPTFIIAVTRPVLFQTPLELILPQFFQLNGLWMAFPIADLLSFLLAVGLLIPLIIKLRKAAAEQQRNTESIPFESKTQLAVKS